MQLLSTYVPQIDVSPKKKIYSRSNRINFFIKLTSNARRQIINKRNKLKIAFTEVLRFIPYGRRHRQILSVNNRVSEII